MEGGNRVLTKLYTCGDIAVMLKISTKTMANFISRNTSISPTTYEPSNGTERSLYNYQKIKAIKKSYLILKDRKRGYR